MSDALSGHAAINQLSEARDKILSQLGRVIVGQEQVVEEILISMFSGGHCLLEGVPGLAKTLMISTLSRALDLSFSRIQLKIELIHPSLNVGKASLKICC